MTAQLLPNVYQQFFGITGSFVGLPLAGGKLYSYQAGTSTPLATYTDETAVTPNTNPIILNSVGAANIWMGSTAYKFILQDSLGNVQWTIDNVSYINPDSIDLTKIDGSIAGPGLFQNGSGSLQINVDDVTIELNGSNELVVKAITPDLLPSTSKLEVVFKKTRDLNDPGSIKQIPQFEWSAPTLFSNPSTIPSSTATVAKWSPNGEFLAVGSIAAPFLLIYQKQGASLISLPNPTTLPVGAVFDLDWSPCGDFLVCANASTTTPSITIYQRYGSYFLKLPNPSSLPPSNVDGVRIAFAPNSDFLSVSYSGVGGVGLILYQRGGSDTILINIASATDSAPITGTASLSTGVITGTAAVSISGQTGTWVRGGTTFTDITLASGLSGIGFSVCWSPDSSLFAAVDLSSGAIDVFERDGVTFSGITPPNVSGLTAISGFSFSPDGNFLAVISTSAPFLALYSVISDTFTLLSNPAIMPPDSATGISWSANSEYLAISHDTTPFMTIYQVSGTTFTKISDPGVLPAGDLQYVNFSPTKEVLAISGSVTPYIQVYETASTLPNGGLLWTREAPNV